MQAELDEIINLSLKKALDHDAKGSIGQAYAYYNAVLELCPSKRSELEKRFTTTLCEWGIYLEQKNRIKDLVKCYQNSLEIFPKSSVMLNNFAAHLLRNEKPAEAIKYLYRALEEDPNFIPAERNLQNAYSMTVDRWHFSMLNDQSRNQAFEEAIRKKIFLGYDTVLDIGTGTGLLSLYAFDAGAKQIYACEYSAAMCDIAKKVLLRNKAHNVKLICKASSELKIPTDINERVKLIVTEIFDAALFGELVIPTLIDAHENLLATDGIIIPMHATLYISAVECEYIRFRSSVLFDKSCYFGSLNFENIIILPDEEYYDTENLENVDLNYVTEPKPLVNINFNDLNELKSFMEDGTKERLTVLCRYDGIIDGLVAWFKLNLDESITLDSSQGKSCWQLAVFPLYPQKVKSNDKLNISAQILNGKLKCSCELDVSKNDSDRLIYQLPRDIISFFNDKDYTSSLVLAAKSNKQESIKTVFDTSPFPIYGLTMLKEHPNCETLYYQTENPALMHLIEHIISKNNIDGKVVFVTHFTEILCTLDNIYAHNFDTKGELIDWGQQSYREVYSCLLSSSGILLPEKIFLMGQVIFSEELSKMVTVKDINFPKPKKSETDIEVDSSNSKYEIAEFINEYKINQVFDLNSSLYNYVAFSEPKVLIELDDSEFKEEVISFGKIDTKSNHDIPNALICWYKVIISDDLVIESKRNNSFMNHTAIVLDSELQRKVLSGENVTIRIVQMRDFVKISVL